MADVFRMVAEMQGAPKGFPWDRCIRFCTMPQGWSYYMPTGDNTNTNYGGNLYTETTNVSGE